MERPTVQSFIDDMLKQCVENDINPAECYVYVKMPLESLDMTTEESFRTEWLPWTLVLDLESEGFKKECQILFKKKS